MEGAFNTTTLVITPEVLDIIAELDEFKGAWRGLGTLAPERLSALRRVAAIESIGASTRLEGSTLSDRDVEKFRSEPGKDWLPASVCETSPDLGIRPGCF
jgi:Fic family protein